MRTASCEFVFRSSSSTSSRLLHCLLFCSLQPSSTACNEHLSENRCRTAKAAFCEICIHLQVEHLASCQSYLVCTTSTGNLSTFLMYRSSVLCGTLNTHAALKLTNFLIPHSRYCCTHMACLDHTSFSVTSVSVCSA